MPSQRTPPSAPRKKNYEGKVSQERLTRQALLERAIELRRQGYTYRAIANELTSLAGRKITLHAAHKMVTSYFRKVSSTMREDASFLLQRQLDRLDALYRGLKDRAENGDARAAEVATKLLDREARLLGLDAPVKLEQKVSHLEVPDPELLDLAQRLQLSLEQQSALPPPDLLLGPLPGESSLPLLPSPLAPPVVDVDVEPLAARDAETALEGMGAAGDSAL